MTDERTWPSVTPIPFQVVEGVIWRDGKPWCSKHRGVVLVRAATLGVPCKTDGGTHVCGDCMRESTVTDQTAAERWAQDFHDTYERLAPTFDYETRPESAVPWADVPEPNRSLMIAVAGDVVAEAVEAERRACAELLAKMAEKQVWRKAIPEATILHHARQAILNRKNET